MKLMKQITKTLAGIKTITYLWYAYRYIMIQQKIHNAPKVDAIPPYGVTDKPSTGGALFFIVMKDIPLTQGYVALVDDEDYEELSKFKWFVRTKGRTQYAERESLVSERIGNKKFVIRMHRVILKLNDKDVLVDHKNGNGLDNRRCNLRICNHFQNSWNRRKPINGTHRFIGVYFNKQKKKYAAFIRKDGRSFFIGYFDIEQDAVMARDEMAIRLRGEYAKLNRNPGISPDKTCYE